MSKILGNDGNPLHANRQIIDPKTEAIRQQQAAYLAQMANLVLSGEVIAFGFVAIAPNHATQHAVWGIEGMAQLEVYGAIMNLAAAYQQTAIMPRPTHEAANA
jgi:hypothetical protein